MKNERPHHNAVPSTKDCWQLGEERQFWFERALIAENEVTRLDTDVRNLEEIVRERGDMIKDLQLRLDLIGRIHDAAAETGWRTSWRLSGITSEALTALLSEARAYTPPMVRSSVSDATMFNNRPRSKTSAAEWRAYADKLEGEITRLAPAVNWKKLKGGKLV